MAQCANKAGFKCALSSERARVLRMVRISLVELLGELQEQEGPTGAGLGRFLNILLLSEGKFSKLTV